MPVVEICSTVVDTDYLVGISQYVTSTYLEGGIPIRKSHYFEIYLLHYAVEVKSGSYSLLAQTQADIDAEKAWLSDYKAAFEMVKHLIATRAEK